jgi:mRNA-degrading endonuclease RelE of RelBE toxin-antitoxin system
MEYRLIFTEDFLKDISKLDHSVKVHLKRLYDKIKENPRRFKPLHGDANSYRLRIMNFRLKYRVVGGEIHMYRFENRDKAYRR